MLCLLISHCVDLRIHLNKRFLQNSDLSKSSIYQEFQKIPLEKCFHQQCLSKAQFKKVSTLLKVLNKDQFLQYLHQLDEAHLSQCELINHPKHLITTMLALQIEGQQETLL